MDNSKYANLRKKCLMHLYFDKIMVESLMMMHGARKNKRALLQVLIEHFVMRGNFHCSNVFVKLCFSDSTKVRSL